MKNLQMLGCSLALVLAAASMAHGQEATERYVPIGQSPGQSGKTTTVGTVHSVDLPTRRVTVASNGATVSLGWTERTRIWLDRSRQQQGALKGMESDIQVGRRIEVKPDKGDSSRADWIKVDPTIAPN
jgi:hypothetical protein